MTALRPSTTRMKRTPMPRRRRRLIPLSEKRRKRNEWWVGQKRKLFVRDPHCQYPGCTEPASNCDPHHIRSGGGDGLRNLVALCRAHHESVHAHRREAEALGLRRSSVRVAGTCTGGAHA